MHYTEPFRDRMFERTVFFTWEYFAPTEFVEKGGGLTEQTAFFRKLLFGKINLFRCRKEVQFRQSPFSTNSYPGVIGRS